MSDFRVYLRQYCLINPSPEDTRRRAGTSGRDAGALEAGAAVLSLLAPKLIDMAIGGVASALRKAGEKEAAQVTAEEFSALYIADDHQALSANPSLGSVLGVWFDAGGKNSPSDDEVSALLKREKLVPEDAAVGGVFEAAIRLAADGTAFFLETRHFSVRDFIGQRGKPDRAYVATLTLATAGATADGDTFAVGQVDLGKQKRGASIVPDGHPEDAFPRFRSNLMPWSRISEVSKSAYERDVAAGDAAGRRYMPVTFSLTVSETADGNAFLLKLGELLGGVAEKAAGELGKRILPQEIAKAAAEAAANAEKLYEEELKAELEVRKAEKAYAERDPADEAVLLVALEIARRKLAWQTRLRAAAGLPPRPI